MQIYAHTHKSHIHITKLELAKARSKYPYLFIYTSTKQLSLEIVCSNHFIGTPAQVKLSFNYNTNFAYFVLSEGWV